MERLAPTINASTGGNKANDGVRTVLTLPPTFYNQHGATIFQNYHDETHHTVTVPDPVAAIWGAQLLDLIPTPQSKEENTASTLVVDVGGLAMSVSLVQQDRVVASSTLDGVGGEAFVQQLVYRILKEAGDETLSNDAVTLALVQTSARSSVLELVNKTQTKVHIPFLFMGRKPDDPHLDITVSRTVLEQAVQEYWASTVIPKLLEDDELSTALPPPTNASTLITSAVTKVLEEGGETPNNIQHILLVGGGSRHKLFEQACQEGISALMGPSPQKLVLPEGPLRAELTAMGAASLLPNFDYSYDNGLERVE
jgi:molecular chaperone DnaK (HSP70)